MGKDRISVLVQNLLRQRAEFVLLLIDGSSLSDTDDSQVQN